MSEPAAQPRPLLLVVATVHLDSQWRWTIQQTIREFLPRTLRENFALFDRYPHYRLSFEGAFRYMLAREYYPQEFEELKRRVAERRWNPVGGMLDAPDVNIASPESLIRHILYGNGFFERELGRASRDIFLPDCFGFGHALPSVAAHCGLRSFSTSKLIKWKAPDTIPFEIARWRGPDGAEIVAAIQPGGYGEGIDEDLSRSEEWVRRLGETAAARVGVRYVGTGDRGGSPDTESLDRLETATADDGPIRVRCEAADGLVNELTPTEMAALPVHDDELLLPTHGTGCWTAQAALKRWNRRNEQLADAAERAALLADWSGGIDYPLERLREAWIRFLWHQMHDDLTGTSIPEAYRFTWNDEAVAANLFAGVLTDSIAALSTHLDTRSDGLPLVVFNASGHQREDVVEALLAVDELPGTPVVVRGPLGRRVPCQIEPVDEATIRLLFLARVDPVSLSTFEVLAANGEEDPEESAQDGPTASATGLENHCLRVEIDGNGDVASVFDKRLGRELLEQPVGFELLENRSNRWPAWEIRPETILDRSRTERIRGPATIRVVEQGPVRATLEIERRSHGSTYLHRVRLAAGAAGERLEIESVVDWATRGRLLKASFPLAARNPEATYDIGVGTIRRSTNRRERYEVPAQQWAEISNTEGDFGVAVLNDCKYGWDKPADNELRLSLLHSPYSWRKYPHQRTQDHGRHRFAVALLGHRGQGEWPRITHHAESLNQPLEAFLTTASPGHLGRSISAVQISDGGVSLRALKKSEDSTAWVARLQEIGGGAHESVRLALSGEVLAAHAVNGCESDARPAHVEDGALVFDIGAAAPRTFLLQPERPSVGAGPPRQEPLALPWDHQATSRNEDDAIVDFDGKGHSIPAELFPGQLTMGGVRFALGASGELSALRCRGQQIELPAGYRRLWLLAASIEGHSLGRLTVGQTVHELRIAPWTGWLAERPAPRRWLGLMPATPGRLTRDELAWVGTHRHRRNTDEPYVFCYLYRYAVDLEPDDSLLTLPHNEALRIFAATLTDGSEGRVRPARALYGDV